ncbi:unnamed protein product [Penicillium salamii]|uniref:Uncharacterized protein n=1 Tax=Penicillium salamii TaxID=1612424 RepID=A0A9W4JWQ3_9EURO|nr:unnamed protein product [Penicillium salamii]CAG8418704.1 unnamed protein product [Penicillium salamii]CAG8419502.1 unnamed protein product [Penicillium salamii]CAG8555727.1 unnamed protein product [Penicillium salamii]
MSSSKPEKNGVAKLHSTRNQPPKEYNVSKLQNLAEGKIPQAKADAANSQASYDRQRSGENSKTVASDKSQPVQPQSKPQYNSQDGQPGPEGSSGAAPVEPNDNKTDTDTDNDTDMGDRYSEPPSPVDVNDQLEDEVLVDLKKLSSGRDQDGEPDAWSRLGRSLVLLVRYGPYKAAKYRVQTANGYNTAGLQKVSKLKSRISHVTYESQDGEEHKRYTRNNIVGIVGVAIHERKDTTKDYKSAPTTYVKIKWQGIDEADQKLLTRGCCWITNADLVRLTDRTTAEQKISDAWDKQEQRYNLWQGQMGRDSPDRSPTPCPLDTFREEKKVKRELTAAREPLQSIEHGPSARKTSLEPGPSERMLGKRPAVDIGEPFVSAKMKQEPDSENELFVSNKNSGSKSEAVSRNAAESEHPNSNDQVVTFSVKTYFEDKAKARGWDWDKMSATERDRKEDELLATYRFYKSQMTLLGGVEVAA